MSGVREPHYLMLVVQSNEVKVAQIGNFEGEPESAGADILTFLRDKDLPQLLKVVKKAKFLPEGSTVEPTYGEAEGVTLLNYLVEHVIKRSEYIMLEDSFGFGYDSEKCEWAYLINFDRMRLEVFKGKNTTPLAEGQWFSDGQMTENGFYGVRLMASWDLEDLPNESDFVDSLRSTDQDAWDLDWDAEEDILDSDNFDEDLSFLDLDNYDTFDDGY